MKCFLKLSFYLFLISLATGRCYGQATRASEAAIIEKMLDNAGDSTPINPKRSLQRAQQAIELAEKSKLLRGVASGYSVEGMVYTQLGDTKKAMEYYTKALQVCTENHFTDIECNTSLNLGNLYAQVGIYDKAFELFTRGLKIKEAAKDTIGTAQIYENIGNVFNMMNSYDEGNKYYSKAIALYTILNDKKRIAFIYGNMVTAYQDRKDYTRALFYARETIRMNETNDTMINYASYLHFASCYMGLGKKDSALYYYSKYLEIANAIDDKEAQMDAYSGMGSVALDKGDLQKAEDYFKKALSIAVAISSREFIYINSNNLAEVYAKKNDYRKAYEYHVKAVEAHDSVMNDEKVKAMAEQTVRFETKETEEKNVSLQKENNMQKLLLQKEKGMEYAGFGVAVLFLIIGFLLLRQHRIKTFHEKLELEQKQLLAQINPHFIFNCLNSIQQFIIQNDVKNANKYLADFALLMRQTLENSKDGTIRLRNEIEYLENYLSFECMRFESKFSYTIMCAENLDKNTVEIPSMIIQPFVENAIRHGLYYLKDRQGILKISFYKNNDQLICEVDDNGIGMEQSQRLKEKMMIKHESHGMDLTRQRLALVSRMNSSDYKISVINKKDAAQEASGTTIIIKFPLKDD